MKNTLFVIAICSLFVASCTKSEISPAPVLTETSWSSASDPAIRMSFGTATVYFAVCNCSHNYRAQIDTLYMDGNVPVAYSIVGDTLTLTASGGYPTKYYRN